MTETEFHESFRRLERLYIKEGVQLEPPVRAEYFAAVRYFTARHLEQAIDLIRDTHKMKSLPTPGEIREAIESVMAQTPRATAEELASGLPQCVFILFYFFLSFSLHMSRSFFLKKNKK